jgi:dihydrofolate synthase/folylpolyglutamate synthase
LPELSYGRALAILDGRGFGIRADLGRIADLVSLLDDPQLSYPAVHLAGTNGKTTTARMISAILVAHGISCGTYTSPHLQTVRERFAYAGPSDEGLAADIISKEDFASTLGYLMPFVEMVEGRRNEAVTYFELTTALAFEWMNQKTVGAGVFEAGMGGAWDATNVVRPSVAVLTHIEVDHTEFLGPTPLDNAREKAGIIKPGAEVVQATQRPEVAELIAAKVKEAGANLATMGRDFDLTADRRAVGGRAIEVRGINASYDEVFVPLHGSHQSVNATIAVAACESFLGRKLDDDALRAGLAVVKSPGRMETVGTNPRTVLDGAHNPDAARALATALRETFADREFLFVVSVLADKDIDGILGALMPLASKVFFAPNSSPRSATARELAAHLAARDVEHDTAGSVADAVDAAVAGAGAGELIVVTGSLYAVGEARDHLLGPIE